MFKNLITIGMIVTKIIADIADLQRDVSLWLMVHNVNEILSSKNAEKNSREYVKKLSEQIEPKIKIINKEIMALNKISTIFEGSFRLKTIKIIELKKIIKSRFDVIAKNENSDLLDQNLELKINSFFQNTRQKVLGFPDAIGSTSKYERAVRGIKAEYKQGINNAIDIMDMGINDVAIFTSGRSVEESLNKLLRVLIKNKLVSNVDIKYTMLNKKIKILYNEKIINEKTYHDLNSVRISRNDSGHQAKIKYTKQEALDSVSQAISLLVRIEKLITKYS